MNITQDFFYGVMPAATTPSKNVFKKISPRIDAELDALRVGLVGDDAFRKLSGIEPALSRINPSREETAADSIAKFACAEAFRKSIPELDLVMTENGFGVVSNANQAPASKERVAELRRSLHRLSSLYLDQISDSLRFVDGWPDSDQAHARFRTLFWRISLFNMLGKEYPVLEDTFDLLPYIEESEQALEGVISPELMDELRTSQRTASTSALQQRLIVLCRVFTAAWIRRDGSSDRCKRDVLRFVERNLPSFSSYAESTVYKANHYKRYENKKDDPCYFF